MSDLVLWETGGVAGGCNFEDSEAGCLKSVMQGESDEGNTSGGCAEGKY